MQKFKRYAAGVLRAIGTHALGMAEDLCCEKSKVVEWGASRSLYRLPAGFDLWLNNSGYIDKCIISKGQFEPASTRAIARLVREGAVVLDVGANIGYYTVLLSRLVGKSGRVIAFEPTRHFGEVLKRNIEVNKLENVEVVAFGLSNRIHAQVIDIGPSSATLHSPPGFDVVIDHESISLTTLNEYVQQRHLNTIDFIKIDIDGHEPLFFDGAWDAIQKYSPVIIFEVSHLHYLEAGVYAWDFYNLVRSKGFKFFNEENLSEISSREEFLRRCANFAYSSNVLIAKGDLLRS
jgi:FkbM family methyltransferase